MKQIDEYVNNVYRDVKGNKKDIEELKIEMKNHLLESVYDLKQEGKSEQQAIEIAIERFGKENELRSVISKLFYDQKTFGKKLVYLGVGILFTSLLIFGITFNLTIKQSEEQQYIAREIVNLVSRNEKVSPPKEAIDALIEDVEFDIIRVEVKNYPTHESSKYSIIYEHEQKARLPAKLLSSYGYGESSTFVYVESVDYGLLGLIIALIGMISSGLLFAMGSIINAYHKRIKAYYDELLKYW